MRGRIRYSRDGERTFYVNGKEVSEEAFNEAFPPKTGVPGAAAPSAWPMVSEALAVHPHQVEEANARNKRNGVNVVYDQKGFAHLPDRNERRKILRLEGFFDRSGGYGD